MRALVVQTPIHSHLSLMRQSYGEVAEAIFSVLFLQGPVERYYEVFGQAVDAGVDVHRLEFVEDCRA